jgi:hypothetical protein
MGSAAAGSLCAFRVTQTSEQDGCDTEDLYAFVPSPRFGEAQIPVPTENSESMEKSSD